MKNVQIKICGITTPEIAKYALLHGANYIGIVFHPASSRHIGNIITAQEISLVTKKYGGKSVGVFVDQNADEVNYICKKTRIN